MLECEDIFGNGGNGGSQQQGSFSWLQEEERNTRKRTIIGFLSVCMVVIERIGSAWII